MRHISLLITLCMGWQLLSSQNKITRELDSFREIKAFDGLSVNLIPSEVNKVVIDGANTDKVAVVNTDGILKLRMEIDMIFSGYKTFIDLYYTDPLIIIDVNEDARISSSAIIKQDVLDVRAQEGGEVVIQAEVEQLLVKSVTGGIITASGTSHNQDVVINTGGVYHGKEFRTRLSTVNVNAGSRAEIFATEYVKATVKAGGEVQVYGNPTKMEEKTVFGGKITRM